MINKLKKVLDVFSLGNIFYDIFTWKVFSLNSFKIIKTAKSNGVNPQTIIDVGANVGQFSYTSAKLLKPYKIISIEPDIKTFNLLKENLKNYNNIDFINCCISSYNGYVNFNINKDSQVSSILPLGTDRKKFFKKAKVQRKISIKVNKLDEILIKKKIKKPILIKIDTQGSEYEILKGAKNILKKTDWIILEIPFKKLYIGQKNFDEIYSLLKKNNFYIQSILNTHYSPNNNEIMEIDVLFKKNN